MHCNGWSGSLRRTPAIIHEYCIVAKPKFSLEFNEGILRVRPLSSHLILHLPGNIPRSLLHLQQMTLQFTDAIGDGHTCGPTHVHQTLHVIRRGPQYLEMRDSVRIRDFPEKQLREGIQKKSIFFRKKS